MIETLGRVRIPTRVRVKRITYFEIFGDWGSQLGDFET